MADRLVRGGMLRQADNGAGSGGTSQAGSNNGTSQQQSDGTSGDQQQGQTPTFETWYAGLDATVKGLVDGHVQGLRTALASERVERGTLTRQIKDIQDKAGKGSDLEKQLSDLQATLTATERKAAFVEDAIRPEVGCVNVKAAYALAVADELFDRQGRPDWNALKAAAPELFRRAGAGSVDGGAGARSDPRLDMNSIIRRAAGR